MSQRILTISRRLSLPLAGLAVLALSACATAGPASTAEPGGSEPVTEAQGEPLTGAECIVGSWLLNNDEFGELMSSFGDRVIDEVSGIARFTAGADGSAVTEYIDWTHVISMSNPDGVMTMVRNGKDTGVYTVEDDGRMSLTEHSNESVIESQLTSQGMTIAVPTVENSPGALHLAVFTCEGDELTLTVDDRSTVMTRES